MNPAEWVAFAGHTQQSLAPQIRQVKRIITSSSNVDDVAPYEVALIQLSEPFELGATVTPICISNENPRRGQFCMTAGWSTKTQNGM